MNTLVVKQKTENGGWVEIRLPNARVVKPGTDKLDLGHIIRRLIKDRYWSVLQTQMLTDDYSTADLVNDLRELHGGELGIDYDITYEGARAGETRVFKKKEN